MLKRLTPEGWTQGMEMLCAAQRASIGAVEAECPHLKPSMARLRALVEDLEWEVRAWRDALPLPPLPGPAFEELK